MVQLLGQIAFWSILLSAISAGTANVFAAAMTGAFTAMVIAILPGLYAELEASQ